MPHDIALFMQKSIKERELISAVRRALGLDTADEA
jgi:hypothetical protein